MQAPSPRVASLVGVSLALLVGVPAGAQCPQRLCDCLGEAGRYVIVAAEDVRFGSGGFLGRIFGDTCATGIRASAGPNSPTEPFTMSLFATMGPGSTAIRLGGSGSLGVMGDVVTGGGSVAIGRLVRVDGVVDESGTNHGIVSCLQAVNDMQDAAGLFASLTPTRHLGSISLTNEVQVLTADPGVNVWAANSIRLRKATLEIETGPSDTVILNTPLLKWKGAIVGGPGVIVNVTGSGAAVSMYVGGSSSSSGGTQCPVRGSVADACEGSMQTTRGNGHAGSRREPVPVLAAQRTIRATNTYGGNLYGRKVRVRGADTLSFLSCSCPCWSRDAVLAAASTANFQCTEAVNAEGDNVLVLGYSSGSEGCINILGVDFRPICFTTTNQLGEFNPALCPFAMSSRPTITGPEALACVGAITGVCP